MCARYNLRISPEKLAEVFATVRGIEFRQRFNISPTQTVVAIRQKGGRRIPANIRWGLVPAWSKDPKSGPPLINARGETVAEKPAFRSAFKKRRCLLVVLLLLLVSAVAWWHWPRGDARFIGKWMYASASIDGVVAFRANGRGTFDAANGFRSSFSWRVSEHQLITGLDIPFARDIAVRVRGRVADVIGTHLVLEEERRELLEVAHKRISLRYRGETIKLTRISE